MVGKIRDFLYNIGMDLNEGQSAERTQEQFHKKCLFEAGVTYSLTGVFPVVAALLLMLIASLAGKTFEQSDGYKYLNYLFSQACFAAAALVYFWRSKQPFKRTFNGCKWQYYVIAVVLQFGLFFALSELNGLFLALLQKLGYQMQTGVVPSLDGWKLLPAILVIAVLPAVMEEVVFRGILVRNVHESGWGTFAAVFITGALFSLFHSNPEQTVYQFVCGACFALLAIRSGSIFPTMLAHFLNNAVVLIFSSVYNPLYGENWSLTQILSTGGYIALLVVSALCLVSTLVYLIWFDKRNHRCGGVKHGKSFFFGAAVGIAVFAVQWILVLAECCGWLK